MISNIYETSYGELIPNLNKITAKVSEYLVTTDLRALEYEFVSPDDIYLCLITGYNEEERDLPIWNHPLPLTINKKECLVVDLRKYMKSMRDEPPESIVEASRDPSSLNFTLLRTMLTLDAMNSSILKHRDVFAGTSVGFGGIISNLVSSVVGLDITEQVRIEIVAGYYYNLLFHDPETRVDMIDSIKAKSLNMRYRVNLGNRYVISQLSQLPDIDDVDVMVDIDLLIKFIKLAMLPDKAKLVTKDVLVARLSNLWYGPGGTEVMIMAIEHPPTWMALVYTSLNNKSYGRSKLSMLLNKKDKAIGKLEYVKHFDNYILKYIT